MRFLLVILLSLISFMQPQAQNCSNSVFNGGDLCQCETIKYTDPADSSNNVVIGDMQEVCKDSGYTKCIGKVDFGYPVAEYCFCPDPTEKGIYIYAASFAQDNNLKCQKTTCSDGSTVYKGESCPCPDGKSTYVAGTQTQANCPQTMCPDGKSSYYTGGDNTCPKTTCSDGSTVYKGESCPCPDGKSTYVAGTQTQANCPQLCPDGKTTYTGSESTCPKTMCPDGKSSYYVGTQNDCPQTQCSNGTTVYDGETCPCPDGKSTYVAGAQSLSQCPAYCSSGKETNGFCVADTGQCFTMASASNDWTQQPDPSCTGCGYYPASTYCVSCSDGTLVLKGEQCPCPDGKTTYAAGTQTEANCPAYCLPGSTAQSDFCVSSQGKCLTKASYASQWQQSAYEEGDCATCGYYPSSTYCVTCYNDQRKEINAVKGTNCLCPAGIVLNKSIVYTANESVNTAGSMSDCPDYCNTDQTQPSPQPPGQSVCLSSNKTCYKIIKMDQWPETQGGQFYGGSDKEHPCYSCGYYGNCANNK